MKTNREKAVELTGIVAPFVGVSISNGKGEDNVREILEILENKITETLNEQNKELVIRVKQFLTALDYSKLSTYQLQVVASLQKEMLKD